MRRESLIVAESGPWIDTGADGGRVATAWHTAAGSGVLRRTAPDLT